MSHPEVELVQASRLISQLKRSIEGADLRNQKEKGHAQVFLEIHFLFFELRTLTLCKMPKSLPKRPWHEPPPEVPLTSPTTRKLARWTEPPGEVKITQPLRSHRPFKLLRPTLKTKATRPDHGIHPQLHNRISDYGGICHFPRFKRVQHQKPIQSHEKALMLKKKNADTRIMVLAHLHRFSLLFQKTMDSRYQDEHVANVLSNYNQISIARRLQVWQHFTEWCEPFGFHPANISTLDLPTHWIAEQGHHRGKRTQGDRYSRDDTTYQLLLQKTIVCKTRQGWRPLTPQARGGQHPILQRDFNIPTGALAWPSFLQLSPRHEPSSASDLSKAVLQISEDKSQPQLFLMNSESSEPKTVPVSDSDSSSESSSSSSDETEQKTLKGPFILNHFTRIAHVTKKKDGEFLPSCGAIFFDKTLYKVSDVIPDDFELCHRKGCSAND